MNTALQFDAMAAEWHAARTVHAFFQHLDGRDYRAAAGLFAEHGTWQRMGNRLTGATEIEAALGARPMLLATRHLVTNMVGVADAEGVAARYYVTVFEDAHAGEGPGRLGGPGAIFASEDRLVETGEGWRFASRNPTLVFRKAGDGN